MFLFGAKMISGPPPAHDKHNAKLVEKMLHELKNIVETGKLAASIAFDGLVGVISNSHGDKFQFVDFGGSLGIGTVLRSATGFIAGVAQTQSYLYDETTGISVIVTAAGITLNGAIHFSTDRVLMIPAFMAESNWVAMAPQGGGYWAADGSGTANAFAHVPIPLTVGDRIKSVKMYGYDSATGGATWTLQVFRNAMTTASTQLGATQTSGSGVAQDSNLTVSGLTEVVAAGRQYFAQFTATTAHLQRLYGLEVTYDRP